jgi:hypothetical protein
MVSLNARVSVPLTVAVSRLSSMSSLSVIHSSGPMSAPASYFPSGYCSRSRSNFQSG